MRRSVAVGRVRLAVDRLAADQPFLAGVLSQWRIEEDESVATMCVGFRHGRLTLRVGPLFVESITLDELQSVLCHEANHVILEHVLHRPEPSENRRAMTIAEETAANQWVAGPLPGRPITLEQYPLLSPDDSTEERYGKLKDVVPDDEVMVVTLDDHSTWGEIESAGVLAQVVVRSAVGGAWDRLTPEQKATVPEAVKAAGGGSSGATLLGQGAASVPWQTVLRRFVGRALNRRPVFSRPPRRFPDLVGVIPGRARQAGKPKVLACIDCSGSMTPAMLAAVSAELASMSRTHEVVVAEFDTKVHAVYPYKPVTAVHGRGGTSFMPLFEQEFLAAQRPDLVCVFTDGIGKAPSEPPRVPVLWALTPKGRRPAAWGREIRMA